MLLLAHLGITVFLAALIGLPIFFSVVGVLVPDILDKFLFYFKITPCGRFISHTILFGPIFSLAVYAVTRRRDLSLAILFGSWMHLIEDAQYFMPWFYPFVNYGFSCMPTRILFTSNTIFAEVIGAILLMMALAYHSKLLYYRDKIYSWLKTSAKYSNRTRTKKKR